MLRGRADWDDAGAVECVPRRMRMATRRLVGGPVLLQPAPVAKQLAVSASTLREWSTL